MPKIAVIGSTGMLGRDIACSHFAGYEKVEINRGANPVSESNQHIRINSDFTDLESKIDLNEVEYVVNCAGLIRQKINENDLKSIEAAYFANFSIPFQLVSLSEKYNFKIIQIGTDCVYSGSKGGYTESDCHDAVDLYGKSKSLGEIAHKNLSVIRTSIIGKEFNASSSLLSWFLSKPYGATVDGFIDQLWNGVTVRHFSKFVVGLIESRNFEVFSGVHHVVPADWVSKDTLLRYIASAFNREDINIKPVSSGHKRDMTLGTNDVHLNEFLWKLAGYARPLSVEEMVIEYSLAIQSGG